ncbi:F-box domain-containing protein [Mycena sanguinolenta]|uniref:F-box domain-containing protein n=1 Tax=Mycena sanguinolenta TaxID=230812 RepID=A0A8H6Z7V9_9AGAR|nr:F-box domain-containing protein [Mycena sanguinolenta]
MSTNLPRPATEFSGEGASPSHSKSISNASPPYLAIDRAILAEIDSQIADLERSVQALRQQRSLVQDRLAAYRYPVLTLPNEIVSEIFQDFLPIYPERPSGSQSPFVLCQICRKWRNIAFATPVLWRACSLYLGEFKLQEKLELLKIFLDLSGAYNLSIKLDNAFMDDEHSDQFAQLIADYCARWEHLDLSMTAFSDHIPAVENPLPMLRTFRLQNSSGLGGGQKGLISAPLLRKVAIAYYVDDYRTVFPWSQLTVLFVRLPKMRQCADILPHLVNVIHCRIRLSHSKWPGPHQVFSDVLLPHLETLRFEGGPSLRYTTILGSLTVPSLRKLMLVKPLSGAAHYIPALAALISRSGCTLQQLCIPSSGSFIDDLRSGLPSVGSFILENEGMADIEEEPFLVVDESHEMDA